MKDYCSIHSLKPTEIKKIWDYKRYLFNPSTTLLKFALKQDTAFNFSKYNMDLTTIKVSEQRNATLSCTFRSVLLK